MHIEFLNSIASAISDLGKTSWLDITSLFVSAASLLFAILIPVRIANKQDKIALFEKRLYVYTELLTLVQFTDFLKNGNTYIYENQDELSASINTNRIIIQFSNIFKCDMQFGLSMSYFYECIFPAIERNKLAINSLTFLYAKQLGRKRIEVSREIDVIYHYLIEYMKSICSEKASEDDYNNEILYISSVDSFMQKYQSTLEYPLKI